MGTAVEVQLTLDGTGRQHEAASLTNAIVSEMLRLQQIFSSVDSNSEFSRWIRGEVAHLSSELTEVLAESRRWQIDSGGRFHPCVAAFSRVWSEAELAGSLPSRSILQTIATSMSDPPWYLDGSTGVWRYQSESEATLNAFAKGWIVDAAIGLAERHETLASITINAGGDIRRSGRDALLVGIENPFRPYDNEPPIAVVRIANQAIATSGSARKGFLIGNTRYSHVIDPRTGLPASEVASISVVGDSAAHADAVSTILGVEPPDVALSEANDKGIAAFIVHADGRQLRTEKWKTLEVAADEY